MIVHIEISTGTRVSGLSKLITLPFGGTPAGKKHRVDKSIVGCDGAVNDEEATQKKPITTTKWSRATGKTCKQVLIYANDGKEKRFQTSTEVNMTSWPKG